jgi:hypothetical protein
MSLGSVIHHFWEKDGMGLKGKPWNEKCSSTFVLPARRTHFWFNIFLRFTGCSGRPRVLATGFCVPWKSTVLWRSRLQDIHTGVRNWNISTSQRPWQIKRIPLSREDKEKSTPLSKAVGVLSACLHECPLAHYLSFSYRNSWVFYAKNVVKLTHYLSGSPYIWGVLPHPTACPQSTPKDLETPTRLTNASHHGRGRID